MLPEFQKLGGVCCSEPGRDRTSFNSHALPGELDDGEVCQCRACFRDRYEDIEQEVIWNSLR
jgi:hypothetical protein